MAKRKTDKDPSFLFYSKDWFQGTSYFMPEEKGIYIDLLVHQHQNGYLPNDTKRLARMVGLSISEFMPIWDTVKSKFIEIEGGKLINKRLTVVCTERCTKQVTNSITGIYASLLTKFKISPKNREKLGKELKIKDFWPPNDRLVDKRYTEWITERLTSWLHVRLKSIEDIYIDNNINKEESINNLREENSEKEIIPEKPKNNFPVYSDFNGLPEINVGSSIELIRITQHIDVSKEDITGLWEVFKIQNLTGEKFYQSEKEVYSHFTNWVRTNKIQVKNTLKNNKNEKLGTSAARIAALKNW